MSEINEADASKLDPFENLFEVFVLCFDELKGHVPLLIYPKEDIKIDEQKMRPINIHSIWFLEVKEQSALDHVDLEYGNKIYFARKFLAPSNRKKRRAGLEDTTPETIIVMLALPTDMDIFGGDLLKKITKDVKENFENFMYQIIESEIAKDEIIKTPKLKGTIEKGNALKEKLRRLICNTCKEYFASVIKQSDATSIKQQKAISFLSLKGVDFSHLVCDADRTFFSSIKLFDPTKNQAKDIAFKQPFEIKSVNVIEDSQELEILVKNTIGHEMNDVAIKITHVKEFFEKEIMNQIVDFWAIDEELLFISPIIPHVNDYLFFIIEEDYQGNKQKLLSKKIDLNTVHKIKS